MDQRDDDAWNDDDFVRREAPATRVYRVACYIFMVLFLGSVFYIFLKHRKIDQRIEHLETAQNAKAEDDASYDPDEDALVECTQADGSTESWDVTEDTEYDHFPCLGDGWFLCPLQAQTCTLRFYEPYDACENSVQMVSSYVDYNIETQPLIVVGGGSCVYLDAQLGYRLAGILWGSSP